MKTIVIRGQECWQVKTPAMDASITVLGGMMAPVGFSLPGGRVVQPYYVSPWQEENLVPEPDPGLVPAPVPTVPIEPAVLVPLRGDFFCLPFGGSNKVGAEDHQPHGESAWKCWNFVSCDADEAGEGPGTAGYSGDRLAGGSPSGGHASGSTPATRLVLGMDYEACKGSVRKSLFIGHDQTYIGTEHILSGFSGSYPLGHHATLAGSTERDGIWELFFPPFDLGLTDPDATEPFRGGEYYTLAAGVEFHDFTKVPSRWKNPASVDLSRFPARRGFIDIAAIYRKPAAAGHEGSAKGNGSGGSPTWLGRIGWTAALNRDEGYLWYSIKDQSLLPATVFWMENQGRHGSPWSGRNSCIGIEETCAFMAAGRARSIQPNLVNQRGIPSAVQLNPAQPLRVRTIQGVLPVPRRDILITGLSSDSAGRAVFLTDKGAELPLPVSPSWVLAG
jgi:hypothetical protein